MAQIIENCKYNKLKILYKLTALNWFIKKHATPDALAEHDNKSAAALDELSADLEKYIKKLHEITCK